MSIHDWLIIAATQYPHFVYVATIVLACAEGPILSVLFGILLQLGYFNFFLVFGALMVGDLIGDVLWYHVGRRFGHRFIARFGKYFGMTEERSAKVVEIFHRRKDFILIISKITNGFGFSLVTLITAGLAHIPFRRYMLLNFLGQFIWTGILIALGYFFGNLYVTIEKGFGRMSAVAAVIVTLAIAYGIIRYVQKTLSKRI